MVGPGDNQQLFVVAFQLLERVFAEVAGVRLFAVDDKHGILDFIRTAHQWEVDERDGFRRIPSLVGVERTFVITVRSLVVGMVVLEELRSIGRQFVGHAATRLRETVTEVLCALHCQFLAERVAGFGAVVGIEIAVGIDATHVVHRRSDCRLDARVCGSGIDGQSAPAADADDTDLLGIDFVIGRKKIDSSRKNPLY